MSNITPDQRGYVRANLETVLDHGREEMESANPTLAVETPQSSKGRLRTLRKTVEYFAHRFRREGGASSETIAELTEVAELLQGLESAHEIERLLTALRQVVGADTLEEAERIALRAQGTSARETKPNEPVAWRIQNGFGEWRFTAVRPDPARYRGYEPLYAGSPVKARANAHCGACGQDYVALEGHRCPAYSQKASAQHKLTCPALHGATCNCGQNRSVHGYTCRKCGVWYAGPNGFHDCAVKP